MLLNARKIPQWFAGLALALPLAAVVPTASAQTPDTTEVFKAARNAEMEAESSIRKWAEFKPGAPYNGRECDEHVGNWCVVYETGAQKLPNEPSKVAKARAEAIVALKRAFDLAPGRSETVFPLVRLLVRDGKAEEAVQIARDFAKANSSPDGHMVLGYALHFTRRTEEALSEFTKWISALPASERDRIEDVDWLVQPDVRDHYRMAAAKLWRYADALYLTPGNETLSDHYARHALAHMLAVRPVPANSDRWGQDEEQLLIRYGPDLVVTRSFVGGQLNVAQSFVGHWDPSEHTYFPPDLDKVLTMRAPTDTLWPTDTLVARSGHAPPTIRLMRSLQHQAAVFPGGQNMLVVVGGAKTDKVSAGKPLAGMLFLLDDNLQVIASRAAQVKSSGDSLVFIGEMPVPAAARFFSAEAYDSTTRYAARARFRLEPPASAGRLRLSGILLTRPFDAGNLPSTRTDASAAPLARPVVAPGEKLGVYSELSISGDQAQTVNVTLEVRSIDRPSAITRLAGFLGSKLGFSSGAQTPGRLGWSLEVQPHQPNAIALTVDPGKMDRGRYLITLSVTDPTSGGVVLAEREFFIER